MTLVTLLSDFGTRDTYAGVVEGAILQVAPDARVLHLTHGVAVTLAGERGVVEVLGARSHRPDRERVTTGVTTRRHSGLRGKGATNGVTTGAARLACSLSTNNAVEMSATRSRRASTRQAIRKLISPVFTPS